MEISPQSSLFTKVDLSTRQKFISRTPETIGRWSKHTSVTTIWVPSLSFDISFLIGEVAPGCRRTERFLIPYMPSTTPGLCLAMSKWANELTIFPTKWRAKWETRYWVGMEHHPVTVFMYLPARERSHLPPKREESSSSKVFFGGHVGSFPRRFSLNQFQPVFLMHPIFVDVQNRYFSFGICRAFNVTFGQAPGTKTVGVSIFPKGKIHISKGTVGF